MMLDSTIAKEVIDYALLRGADFAEIFVDRQTFESISIKSSNVENIENGINFGIGIRLFYGTKVLYGYTNSTNKEELLDIVSSLSAKDLRDPLVTATNFNFEKPIQNHFVQTGLKNNISLDQKIPLLLEIDRLTRGTTDKITQVPIGTSQRFQEVEIFNSEGLHVTDERNYVRLRASCIASDGTIQDSAGYSPGAMLGWEFIQGQDPKYISEKLAKEVLTKLKAKPCPAGKMPVVIDNGFGGVIFHEACGHLLETTSVAKKASVFWDKMDQMIASSVVSAVDDGTNQNYWGSINIDDEGMKTQKTQLIKDGKLTSFMVDKMGSMKTGFERTGSGRRENYKYAPTSRMRNTYIEAGKDKFEDMIASIDHGIYCAQMGGGSVSPGTGEFNFSVIEGYEIKNGKIGDPVKGATLIGTGPDALKQISMVSDNLDFAAGVCGSISGGVNTTVGQPALKVDEILVGGGK
ncbi:MULTISPECIES: TldD/PmbA family protein [unclassified Halobacteriovorax]|uniref:TldD/PmbA family protein n=2 Tax=unclassified Halobacteriovorax TaxID=2639665 RepID=UPI001E508F11|nr:TldD/PmbA family protein [Halobacteriovorax sp. DA5]